LETVQTVSFLKAKNRKETAGEERITRTVVFNLLLVPLGLLLGLSRRRRRVGTTQSTVVETVGRLPNTLLTILEYRSRTSSWHVNPQRRRGGYAIGRLGASCCTRGLLCAGGVRADVLLARAQVRAARAICLIRLCLSAGRRRERRAHVCTVHGRL